ncbi:hypothetical protein [Actinoplanes sp. NPDC026623]|uniref:hypothetical protein n=1 Tax=Actinoplanes sp. NPDC026623 TaxID=3155610 RepID=UPI0033C82DD4
MSSWAFECYRDALDEMASAGADVVDIGAQYMEVDENVSRRLRGLLTKLGD